MNGVGPFPLLAAAERQQLSCLLRQTPEPVRRSLTGEDGTSPLQTRVWDFRQPPSGRFSSRRRRTPAIATSSARCAYKITSGRRQWPNRDPIYEAGGFQLYSFVANNPILSVDILGLAGCQLHFNFDDDEAWYEKFAQPRNTKWLKTMEEAWQAIEEAQKTCCCIESIHLTQHGGEPGSLALGSDGAITSSQIAAIQAETDRKRRALREEQVKRELEFLSAVRGAMCEGAKITFVQCNSGQGPEGEQLQKWLQGIFGADVDVTLFAGEVRWFYGQTRCTTSSTTTSKK